MRPRRRASRVRSSPQPSRSRSTARPRLGPRARTRRRRDRASNDRRRVPLEASSRRTVPKSSRRRARGIQQTMPVSPATRRCAGSSKRVARTTRTWRRTRDEARAWCADTRLSAVRRVRRRRRPRRRARSSRSTAGAAAPPRRASGGTARPIRRKISPRRWRARHGGSLRSRARRCRRASWRRPRALENIFADARRRTSPRASSARLPPRSRPRRLRARVRPRYHLHLRPRSPRRLARTPARRARRRRTSLSRVSPRAPRPRRKSSRTPPTTPRNSVAPVETDSTARARASFQSSLALVALERAPPVRARASSRAATDASENSAHSSIRIPHLKDTQYARSRPGMRRGAKKKFGRVDQGFPRVSDGGVPTTRTTTTRDTR